MNFHEPDSDRDHLAYCKDCKWAYWSPHRHAVDLEIVEHQRATEHSVDSAKARTPAATTLLERYDWPESPTHSHTE